jgi:hypothetical protein
MGQLTVLGKSNENNRSRTSFKKDRSVGKLRVKIIIKNVNINKI